MAALKTIPHFINISSIGYMLLLAIAKWLPLSARFKWEKLFFDNMKVYVNFVWLTALGVSIIRIILIAIICEEWSDEYRWFDYIILYGFHAMPLLVVLFFNYLTFKSISRYMSSFHVMSSFMSSFMSCHYSCHVIIHVMSSFMS